MPIYQVAIEKQLGTEFWVNDWYVDAPSVASAHAMGDEIMDFEQDLSLNVVQFVRMRVRPAGTLGNSGTIFPVTGTGSRPAGPYLPLFNTLNLIMSVPVGRPSRKYLRLPLLSADVGNGVLTNSAMTYFQTQLSGHLPQMPDVCDESGQQITHIGIVATVGMRQLRRGSRRKTLPIF